MVTCTGLGVCEFCVYIYIDRYLFLFTFLLVGFRLLGLGGFSMLVQG